MWRAGSCLMLFLAAIRLQFVAGQCGSSCWMSTEQFDKIPFGTFSTIIREMRLIGNNLLDIDHFPVGYIRLATIVLKGHPRITFFPNFENISFPLKYLTIQYTSMRTVKPYNLHVLKYLRNLDMSHNQLVSPFPDMDPSRGCSMRELHLDNNSLSEIPYLPVMNWYALTTVSFSRNDNLTDISKANLGSYRKVTHLDIEGCKLTTVPDFSVLAQESIAPFLEINLEGNDIKFLDPENMKHLKKATWSLRLAYNPITRIPNMLHIDVRARVELAENQIFCDCRSAWMKVAWSLPAYNLSAITCSAPEAVTGQKVSDLDTDQLGCQGKYQNFNLLCLIDFQF